MPFSTKMFTILIIIDVLCSNYASEGKFEKNEIFSYQNFHFSKSLLEKFEDHFGGGGGFSSQRPPGCATESIIFTWFTKNLQTIDNLYDFCSNNNGPRIVP